MAKVEYMCYLCGGEVVDCEPEKFGGSIYTSKCKVCGEPQSKLIIKRRLDN